MSEKIVKTKKEWKEILSNEQYQVLIEKGTERPFTGEFDKHFEEGKYTCAACGHILFTSEAKFNSGCGWPAFVAPVNKQFVDYKKDVAFGMTRVEILCSNCGGHLGHVFNDGPTITKERYCVNSASLKFDAPK